MIIIDADFNHDVWNDTDYMFVSPCKCEYCQEEFHGRFVDAVHEYIRCPGCGRSLSWGER